MATSISSIGVGSGLPLDTLLQQLRTAENAPLAALQNRADKEQQRLSAYGTLKSSMESLSKAATALGKGETFHGVKASVTGESFTATTKAGSGVIPGSYSVSVGQLARAQVLHSTGQASRNDSLVKGAPDGATPAGMVDIRFTMADDANTEVTISIDAAKSSLEDIVKAINAKSDLPVSATLMNDGSETTPHRLMLAADQTGERNAIQSITIEPGDGATDQNLSDLRSVLAFGDASSTLTEIAAQNAKATINGIDIESQTNNIENAIDGVTLALTKRTEGGQPDTLRVERDDTIASKAVNDFVNAYNALQNTIKSLTSYDVASQKGAALTGDSLARSAQSRIRDAISGFAVDGMTLSSIGITTDPNSGNLKVDTDKLNEALQSDRVGIERLFSEETGLSKRVTSAVEVFTKSDGLIKNSQDGISEALKRLEKQYEQTEMRIDQKMETYRRQFVQLDSFMAQMNGVSSYLTQQLSMLGNLNSGSSK